jgi:hypothetical protein
MEQVGGERYRGMIADRNGAPVAAMAPALPPPQARRKAAGAFWIAEACLAQPLTNVRPPHGSQQAGLAH